jgi:hypothetical protein
MGVEAKSLLVSFTLTPLLASRYLTIEEALKAGGGPLDRWTASVAGGMAGLTGWRAATGHCCTACSLATGAG